METTDSRSDLIRRLDRLRANLERVDQRHLLIDIRLLEQILLELHELDCELDEHLRAQSQKRDELLHIDDHHPC